MPQKKPIILKSKVIKLVHGGQALAIAEDGKKALLWGALPEEEVGFVVTKNKKTFYEGVTQKVIIPSEQRVIPEEENYLSTSPWQILNSNKESFYKTEIVKETFSRVSVNLPSRIKFHEPDNYYGYRNKMEYSFFGDENGLHLALYNRGTHYKQIVDGSKIAKPNIDNAAKNVLSILQKYKIRASDLKTLVVRCTQDGVVACALFVKEKKFKKIQELSNTCNGVKVIYSNPKSPASVITEILYEYGDTKLVDKINSIDVSYDVLSFFQVNVPEFNKAVVSIKNFLGQWSSVDMFCGVGSIGIGIGGVDTYIESDENNVAWLKQNLSGSDKIINTKSEVALDYIDPKKNLIVDPPRAGLHANVVHKINEIKPAKIAYLSCNPVTQARDIEMLSKNYKIDIFEIFNFFPRTPHIETLALLVRR